MAADQSAAIEFFHQLLEAVPEFKAVYEDDLEYYEEILPIMFVADLARYVVKQVKVALADPTKASEADSVCRRTVSFLDDAMGADSGEVEDWIYLGFLEGLLQVDEQVFQRLKTFFGPNLTNAWTTHFQK